MTTVVRGATLSAIPRLITTTAGKTAVLEVPSAVIPRECNYLLNPAHPHLTRVRVVGRTPFSFDSRLLS